MRVSAQRHDARTPQAVAITQVVADGHPAAFTTRGDTPLALTTAAAPTLLLHLDGRPDPVPVPPAPPPPPADEPRAPTAPEPQPAHSPTPPAHFDLTPVGGDLIAGLENRLLLRAHGADGRPLAHTPLTVHSPALRGPLPLTTDQHGLATLTLLADRPLLELQIRSEAPPLIQNLTLRPVGRELTLDLPPVAAPGTTLRVRVATLRPRGTLSCELLHANATWAQALDLPFTSPRFQLELPLPDLPVGTRLHLQCALTPGVGLAWASLPITLGPPTEGLQAALTQTHERLPRRAPQRLHSTRATDLRHVEEHHATTQRLLFVALGSVLLSLALYLGVTLVSRSLQTRRQLAAVLAEDPALSAPERRAIARTRGALFLIIGLALGVGWVAALAVLFG